MTFAAGFAALLIASLAWGATGVPQVREESFPHKGRAVRVETYAPPGPGRFPAVILLYGADGFEPHAESYRASAEQLAGHGYVAFLVHYFDATGTVAAGEDEISRYFLDWMDTAGGAVTFAGSKSNVDAHHIGLLGFSLGASLALSLASQNERIGAVAEFYGTLPPLALALMKHMPPVLILHGTADPIVPVKEAYDLEHALKSKGIPYQIHIYPGQGHGFTGQAARDAARRTLSFFDAYLKT
ncbi:MAG TPA: dienelactone hydrolase family protein [Bryobacteraceae bacterium]|nr:dienelactone hydrolase family protein [Bryobacteraceae bacterium]